MYISHSVMEGQRHNNPLNPHCFCLQRPQDVQSSSQITITIPALKFYAGQIAFLSPHQQC